MNENHQVPQNAFLEGYKFREWPNKASSRKLFSRIYIGVFSSVCNPCHDRISASYFLAKQISWKLRNPGNLQPSKKRHPTLSPNILIQLYNECSITVAILLVTDNISMHVQQHNIPWAECYQRHLILAILIRSLQIPKFTLRQKLLQGVLQIIIYKRQICVALNTSNYEIAKICRS